MTAIASLLVMAATGSLLLPQPDPAVRPIVCLNGEWQFQPADDALAQMPGKAWDRVPIRIPSPWNVNAFSAGDGGDFRDFPSYPAAWEKVMSAWQRRTVAVPAGWRGKRVFLHFDAVQYWADVYVNGRKVGSHEGGFTPWEIDVTDAVRLGRDNDLLVGVRARQFFDVNGRTPYGWGSFWGEHARGIWQDVFLLARPTVYVAEPYVRTSVANHTLRIEATVVNTSARPVKARLDVAVRDWDKTNWRAKPVAIELASDVAEIAPGASATVVAEKPWPDAKLWWPEDPHLYVAGIKLVSDNNAAVQPMDELPVRFGFREFKLPEAGGKFTLNGRTFTGRGDAWHFMGVPQLTPAFPRAWYEMDKAINVNIIRLHAMVYPEYYLDVADEMGMLIVDESSLWGSGGNFWYGDDGFRRRGVQHLHEFVLRDRNHPAVAIWSVGNEIAWMNPAECGVKSRHDICQLFADLAAGMKALDPDREVSNDGDGDLDGLFRINSLHYPGPDDPGAKPQTFTIGESGCMFYSKPPIVAYRTGERAYLGYHDCMDAVGLEAADLIEGYRRWAAYATPFNVQWYGLEPLPIDVKFHYDRLDTPGMKPERLGSYCTGLNAGRDPKLPAFIPNPVHDHVAEAFHPVEAFVVERGCSVFAGGDFVRHVRVHNDTLDERNLEMRWTLTVGGDKLAEGTKPVPLSAGDWRELTITAMLPTADAEAVGELTVGVYEGEKADYSVTKIIYVMPKIVPATPANSVIVLASSVPVDAGRRVELLKMLADGTNILDLGGDKLFPPGGDWQTRGEFKLAFPKLRNHPVLAGLKPEQLQYWAPDGLVGKIPMWGVPPVNLTPIITCGDGAVAMGEVTYGKGRAILCRMAIADRTDVEPAAAVLLRNAINYLSTAKAPAWQQPQLLVGDDGISKIALWSLGLLGDEQPAAPANPGVCILSGDAPDDASVTQARAIAEAGGQVLVVNPTAKGQAALGKLVGGKVTLTPTDVVQLIRAPGVDDDPLLAGLDLSDLYWLEESEAEEILPLAIAVDGAKAQPLLVTNRGDWRRWVTRGENIKPGSMIRSERAPYDKRVGLMRVPVGKGQVVLCGMPILASHTKSMRVFSQLLTNLGVPLRSVGVSAEKRAQFHLRATGSITAWLTLGPFRGDWQKLYADDLVGGETTTRPMAGQFVGDMAWAPRYAPPMFVLSDEKVYGKLENAALCLATYINAPTARQAILFVSSDDDVKVWLNGKLVHANSVGRPLLPDEDKVGPVDLQAGWNALLVKVINRTANWGIAARVVSPAGKAFDDMEIAADRPDAGLVEIPTDGWKAQSSPPGDVALAFDRKPETRWTSGRAQDDKMSFTLDLGQSYPVRRIVLDSEGSPGDYPRGFIIDVSEDGQTWRTVAKTDRGAECQAGGVTTVSFEAAPARYVRIKQTGSVAGLFWSIHELHVYR